jgi:hypothetical protein
MTTWADAHRSGAVLAAQIHADLDVDIERPVDVFDAVQRLGLVLAFAPLGRIAGVYVPETPSQGILLHSGHPRTRQRYTAAHELGHHAFGHAAEIDGDLEGRLRGNIDRWPDHEKEAEAFGAWFLMPRRLLRAGLADLDISRPESPFDVYALSLWLGTSFTATARQLGATRLADRAAVEAWVRVPPREIKRALAGDLTPDDLRHDVWWLDARKHDHLLDMRPGDRLVLTLDEIPTSGHIWRFVEVPDYVDILADSAQGPWEPAFDKPPTDPAEVELAGSPHPRAFVLGIDADATKDSGRLILVKDQPWNPGESNAGRFVLHLSVHPPLHGLQLSAEALALSA